MYTNFDRLRTLESVAASMTRYNGPLGIVGKTPEGVDDDIYTALVKINEQIKQRINEVNDMDLEREAV